LLGAQHDVFVSPALVQETARVYRTEARIFPNMAHAMMLEARWQEVADALLAWLAEQPLHGRSA
jgi:predicted ATP-grasp superfamily ATP-dependent carboligase